MDFANRFHRAFVIPESVTRVALTQCNAAVQRVRSQVRLRDPAWVRVSGRTRARVHVSRALKSAYRPARRDSPSVRASTSVDLSRSAARR